MNQSGRFLGTLPVSRRAMANSIFAMAALLAPMILISGASIIFAAAKLCDAPFPRENLTQITAHFEYYFFICCYPGICFYALLNMQPRMTHVTKVRIVFLGLFLGSIYANLAEGIAKGQTIVKASLLAIALAVALEGWRQAPKILGWMPDCKGASAAARRQRWFGLPVKYFALPWFGGSLPGLLAGSFFWGCLAGVFPALTLQTPLMRAAASGSNPHVVSFNFGETLLQFIFYSLIFASFVNMPWIMMLRGLRALPLTSRRLAGFFLLLASAMVAGALVPPVLADCLWGQGRMLAMAGAFFLFGCAAHLLIICLRIVTGPWILLFFISSALVAVTGIQKMHNIDEILHITTWLSLVVLPLAFFWLHLLIAHGRKIYRLPGNRIGREAG